MAEPSSEDLTRFADMFAAMGAEPRLRIVVLLSGANAAGLTAGEMSTALGITPSTLSHHLDRLKREDIVTVRRKGTFLHYTANSAALEEVVRFLATLGVRPR
jgi:DNA-binding transcriptional ArsR family regulator